MKALFLVLVTVGISGCAVYPAPHGAYGYGDGGYRYSAPSRTYYPNHPRRVYDQDRDGIPNRRDRDRDGDGTPNRWDSQPSDPRRR